MNVHNKKRNIVLLPIECNNEKFFWVCKCIVGGNVCRGIKGVSKNKKCKNGNNACRETTGACDGWP